MKRALEISKDYCPRCRRVTLPIRDGDFCPDCGARLIKPPAKKKCACGQAINPLDKNCIACGVELLEKGALKDAGK